MLLEGEAVEEAIWQALEEIDKARSA